MPDTELLSARLPTSDNGITTLSGRLLQETHIQPTDLATFCGLTSEARSMERQKAHIRAEPHSHWAAY